MRLRFPDQVSDAAAGIPSQGATLAGVDGCRRGWVAAIEAPTGEVALVGFSTLSELLGHLGASALVAIDIPIGLLEEGARACDEAARRLLGPRRSSVFPAPLRSLLAATSHAEASARHRAITGKGLSLQAWGLFPKVTEVDRALADHPAWRERVREVHPELSFTRMNGGTPLAHGKKRPEGKTERLTLLRKRLSSASARLLAQRPRPLGCAADDVLDALAALWTARRMRDGIAERLPADAPRDARGLRMAISV